MKFPSSQPCLGWTFVYVLISRDFCGSFGCPMGMILSALFGRILTSFRINLAKLKPSIRLQVPVSTDMTFMIMNLLNFTKGLCHHAPSFKISTLMISTQRPSEFMNRLMRNLRFWNAGSKSYFWIFSIEPFGQA